METQMASTLPSQLPLVGGMATIPSRAESLRIALDGILPQLDHLFLYLDKHSAVPETFIGHSKITPILPEGRQLEGTGKFLGLRRLAEPCLYFCFDDDIIYPPSYVAYLASVLRRHRYRALVGVHGNIFRQPVRSYVADRICLHFERGLELECVVDELGTGTLAFHSECINLDPTRWQHMHMSDLMVAIEAMRQEVPRLAVRRPPHFLKAITENQPDSLWLQAQRDDSMQTKLLQAAMAHYPERWCQSGLRTS